jgi:hypothetical protein
MMECISVSDKIQISVRKLRNDVHDPVFDKRGSIIPSTKDVM